MTSATKKALATTVKELSAIRILGHATHYTEIEIAVLCYLADAIALAPATLAEDAATLRACDLTTTSIDLQAVSL